MRNEEVKGIQEKLIFSEFVELSGGNYDLHTVKKRPTPEPDILCVHETEGPIAFELAELCDSNLAKGYANRERTPIFQRTSDPTWQIVKKKLKKKYVTEHPLELLFYTNGRIVTPQDLILSTIRAYLPSSHVYRKIWLLRNKEVVPVWPS